MSRYVVRYCGSGVLHFKKLNITFRKGDIFDLVEKTGLNVSSLETHPEIKPYLGNQLELIEVLTDSDTVVENTGNTEVHKKLDLLLESLKPEIFTGIIKEILKNNIDTSNDENKKENKEEEKTDEALRQNLMKDLVFKRDSGMAKINLDNFGNQENKIKNSESNGLDDFIDF